MKRTSRQNMISSRIREFRLREGLTQPQLAQKLGITKNAVTNWEAGYTRPDLGTIPLLCAVLHITADELFGMPSSHKQLSQQETEWLLRLREMQEDELHILYKTATSLLEARQIRRKRELSVRCVRIPWSGLKTCAGLGIPLDDPGEERYQYLYRNELVNRTDAVITVTGDSMEPVYHNGDDLLVEFTPVLRPGEIGIFVIAGEGLVKEYRTDGLYPKNAKYSVIRPQPDDNLRCVGRVLGAVTSDMRVSKEDEMLLLNQE